jgi:hypothetical protein
LTQPVHLKLGSLPVAIPTGSFKQASNGDYVFQGETNAAAVDFRISPVTNTSFTFRVDGSTKTPFITPFAVTNPANFFLMIGNNKATAGLPWK